MQEELRTGSERHSEHRKLVLECITSAGGRHLTAEQVFEEVKGVHPGIGIATVYRNLKHLEESGSIVKSIVSESGASVYEVAGPEGSHSHHHLICLSCGKVEDLGTDLLDAIEKHVEDKNGFKVKDHRLQIFGVCKSCSEEKSLGC
jgi:Fur family ferric uptake transcriptional regulator